MSQTENPSLAAKVTLGLLWLYKAAISPFLGNNCRFEPYCSDYAKEAILTHGVWPGLFLAMKRIVRCHPYNRGGVDPVPPRN